jgi:predicted transcriptional regulator
MERPAAELTQITTRVDVPTLQRLDALCESEKRSRSFVLLEALEQRLDREAKPESVAA